ncbi:MAG: xanthine dehydrogenase family protein molybdopterin-binding subunit [Archangiaceae bacterium]|nr:xanthine dehydrogenase family protein molybdopterin-binding subunit [Archangiaceae bacterium]
MSLSRRDLVKAAGLVIAFRIPHARAAEPRDFVPNAWLKVSPANEITVLIWPAEMGQGVITSSVQLVAEELEVDPKKVVVELAPADRRYANPAMGMQMTGGSTSTRASWEPLRLAGATAREMLKAAAAQSWKVPLTSVVARDGFIEHPESRQRASYGELASAAAEQSPGRVELKKKDFTVIGQSVDRLDARDKVNGKAVFGIDVKVPGALTAVVVRCPVFGGTPRRHDETVARKMPGVKHIVTTPNGVAVLADHYWHARNAANTLKVQWNEGPVGKLSTRSFRENARALAMSTPGMKARTDGDVEKGKQQAAKTVEAVYEAPWLAHAPMEPMNCTAHVQPHRCDVWAPTQGAGATQNTAAQICELPADQVFVHQTLLGGGFGRRAAQDWVAEAVFLSKAVGAPVKVVWSREDDTRHSVYRPATYNVLAGGVTAEGEVAFWQHQIVSPSIIAQNAPTLMGQLLPAGSPSKLKVLAGGALSGLMKNAMGDPTATEGAATFSYDLPNVDVRWVLDDPGVPLGFFRSVGHSHHGFIVEGFIDELAHAAGKDPFDFRRALLQKAPRNLGVLERVARESGWGKALPEGRGRGIAQHNSFGSWAAAVAEVSVADGAIRVHRLVLAIDCGQVVNPGLVRAQLESAAVFGLSMALKQNITLEKGRVQQGNFHDYPVLRMHESPVIETHLVQSDERPTGVGELMVPVTPPAVANAVFAATGQRLRAMPFKLEG